jgi:ligand-binding SRPBCC domain-containing protein
MAHIHLETRINAPIERVFDLARDIDLHLRSMAHTGERAVGGRTSGRIELGELVTWRARHLGMDRQLTSRITALEPSSRFVDEQEAGPFESFRHEHRFRDESGSTIMVDDWSHVPPYGFLGEIADKLVLERRLRRLLSQRAAAIKAEAERS